MRSPLPSLRSVAPVSALLLLMLYPLAARAQDDAQSLGDLARQVRSSKLQPQSEPASAPVAPEPARTIIDNDNLAQVMEDARKARPAKQDKTVFSIDTANNTVKVSSPDVTCSLSFNARASSLLIKPVLVEDLPLNELLKIDGPGSIQDEALQLEVFNGTDWDLREITIGLTLERKPGENAEMGARARVIPAAQNNMPVAVERRSDVTLLYHLKAEAKPFSTTTFHEDIGITPGPDEDWRWSIVEARGIRPEQARSAPDSLQEPLFGAPSPFEEGSSEPHPAPDKLSLDNSAGPVPTPPR
ncbi:MAG: hypothetical protein ABSB87_15305 [Terriglobales bacterium]